MKGRYITVHQAVAVEGIVRNSRKTAFLSVDDIDAAALRAQPKPALPVYKYGIEIFIAQTV
jgi:hypothetical protein